MRPFDDQVVVARAQRQLEHLDLVEEDAGGQARRVGAGADGAAGMHPEADQLAGELHGHVEVRIVLGVEEQPAFLVAARVAVEHQHQVDLGFFDGEEVGRRGVDERVLVTRADAEVPGQAEAQPHQAAAEVLDSLDLAERHESLQRGIGRVEHLARGGERPEAPVELGAVEALEQAERLADERVERTRAGVLTEVEAVLDDERVQIARGDDDAGGFGRLRLLDLAGREELVRLAGQEHGNRQADQRSLTAAALDPERTLDPAGVVGQAREDLGLATVDDVVIERLHLDRLGLIPVRRREDEGDGVGEDRAVCGNPDLLAEVDDAALGGARTLGPDDDFDVRGRPLAEHHVVAVRPRHVGPGQRVFDDVRRAATLGDDDGRRVAVHHSDEGRFDRLAAHLVGDLQQARLLHDTVGRDRHADRLRLIPVRSVEGQAGAVGLQSVARQDRHHSAGRRRFGEHDIVAADEGGRSPEVDGAGLLYDLHAAAWSQDRRSGVGEVGLDVDDRDGEAFEQGDLVVALVRRIGSGGAGDLVQDPWLVEGQRRRRVADDVPDLALARPLGDLQGGAAQAVRRAEVGRRVDELIRILSNHAQGRRRRAHDPVAGHVMADEARHHAGVRLSFCRLDPDRLGDVPVGGSVHQLDRVAEAAGRCLGELGHRAQLGPSADPDDCPRRGGGDGDRAGRRARQDDGVAVKASAGDDGGLTALLADDDSRFVVVGDMGGDLVRLETVERKIAARHAVADDAAVAPQVVGDDVRGFAADPEDIGAEAARNHDRGTGGGAVDEEAVVAFGRVDLDLLDVDEVHQAAGAEHTVGGDDVVVAELGADDLERVEAAAAVDVDRGPDHVLDQVGAATGRDIDAAALRVHGTDMSERAHREDVVGIATQQVERRLVVEDDEVVRPVLGADGGDVEADAVRQEAARGLDRLELIGGIDDAGEDVVGALRVVQLAELEVIANAATEQLRRRQVVIQVEFVAPADPLDDQVAVDARVGGDVAAVVDPLDVVRRARATVV